MKAVVLAAGKAPSLTPFSDERAVAMLRLCGRTVIEHNLTLIREAGIGDAVIVIDEGSNSIPDLLGDGRSLGLSLEYVRQRTPGIGGALLDAEGAVGTGEHFLLLYGDTLSAENLVTHLRQGHHVRRTPVAAVCLTEYPERYGVVYLDSQMRITRVVEQPQKGHMGNYVLAGAYVLPRALFGILREVDARMSDAMERLINRGPLHAVIWDQAWVDMRYPWDILTANQMLMARWGESVVATSARVAPGAVLDGPVHISPNVQVMSGAVLRGPCYIGAGSFIGHHALIREYTSLGEACQVGFGVELKNCVVLGSARIGRLSFIGDSVIGEGVHIGAGTMTINHELDDRPVEVELPGRRVNSNHTKLGSFIGDRVRVGASNTLAAGTLVLPDVQVPHHYSYRGREGGER
jgi:bifunctional UDP-N-acetylglucosamine pyrophosphorylase/glucosamine-1-phosphate N-acetyltransferase